MTWTSSKACSRNCVNAGNGSRRRRLVRLDECLAHHPRGAATKLGTARRIIARCATPRNATTRYACLHDGAPQAHASKAPEEALKQDSSVLAAKSPGEGATVGALESRALAEAANCRFRVEPWQAKNKKRRGRKPGTQRFTSYPARRHTHTFNVATTAKPQRHPERPQGRAPPSPPPVGGKETWGGPAFP